MEPGTRLGASRKILLVLLLLLLLVLTSQQFLITSTILLTSIKPSKWGFVLVRLHKAMIGQFRGQLIDCSYY